MPANMASTEKGIFHRLIASPGPSVAQLANKIKASWNTIAKLKGGFLRDGLMAPKVIPNLDKLGIQLLTFIHMTFGPTILPSQTKEAIEKIQRALTPI